MPARLCFKVSSGMDSRIVMDQKGGELLLGKGDMLFLSPKSHKLMRAQGTLVEDAEIRRVVRFMRDVASPSFERSLIQLRPGDEEGKSWQEHAQEDELFDKAVDIILETGRGSVSLLQRRLAIGYTRASRLVDLMGMAGIIGEHKGSVAREVMISPEEWAAMKAQAAKDAASNAGAAPADAPLFAAPAREAVPAAITAEKENDDFDPDDEPSDEGEAALEDDDAEPEDSAETDEADEDEEDDAGALDESPESEDADESSAAPSEPAFAEAPRELRYEPGDEPPFEPDAEDARR